MLPPQNNASSVRAVAIYKFSKGTLQLLGALAIVVGMRIGGLAWLPALSEALREHFSAAWSERVAELLLQLSTPRHLQLLALALGLDGALGWFESVALQRNYRWAKTFVIVATSLPVPYELYEIARSPRLGRVLLLLANLAMVALLVRARRAELRQAAEPSG